MNLSVFSAFSLEYLEYKADGSFESLDSDGDGFISLNEFIDELLSQDRLYQKDSSHRDLISEQEVKKDIKDYIDKNFGGDTGKAFDSFDNNPQDGKLDQDELTAALNKIAKDKDKSYWFTGTIAKKIIQKCDKEPCDDKLTKEELQAATKGDPHFVTWYGNHFSYHGACDLVLVHNPFFGNGKGLDLHVRTQHMLDGAYSFVSNASVRIGNDVLEVVSTGQHLFNGIEGAQLPLKLSGNPVTKNVEEICRDSNRKTNCSYMMTFDVTLGINDQILIKVASNMVHVDVKGTHENFSGSTGLMGTYPAKHHGKISRDGVNYIQDSDRFAEEWQVLETEAKLFQESRFPQHPEKCIPATKASRHLRSDKVQSQQRTHAEEACAHVRGPEWEFCVFDVMATGDYGMAATIYG